MPPHKRKIAELAAGIYEELRSRRTRKAINFDLETAAVLRETGLKSTAPAYSAIRSYMESHGFKHRQYSGYISKEPMTMQQARDVIKGLEQALPWITKCYERCDATAILGPSFDFLAVDEIKRDDYSEIPSVSEFASHSRDPVGHDRIVDINPDDFTPEEQSLTLDAIAELYQSYCDAFNRENDGRCPGTGRGDAR